MRMLLITIVLATVICVPVAARDSFDFDKGCQVNGTSFDMDDGVLVIEDDESGDIVEINEEYELYINGRKIKTSPAGDKLLKEFYVGYEELMDEAKAIGLEGAKIGIEGARIGLKAIGGVFKVIFTSYDGEDLERDMERAAEKIEAKAERLEDRAEEIEDMAHDLEDIGFDLCEEIPELDELDWF